MVQLELMVSDPELEYREIFEPSAYDLVLLESEGWKLIEAKDGRFVFQRWIYVE